MGCHDEPSLHTCAPFAMGGHTACHPGRQRRVAGNNCPGPWAKKEVGVGGVLESYSAAASSPLQAFLQLCMRMRKVCEGLSIVAGSHGFRAQAGTGWPCFVVWMARLKAAS